MERRKSLSTLIEQLFFPITLFLTFLILLETIVLIVVDKRNSLKASADLARSSQKTTEVQGITVTPTKTSKTVSVWVFDPTK